MTNQTIEKGMGRTWIVASKVYRVARITAIVIVTLLAILGGYVLTNSTLRNQTIDYAQHQPLKGA